MVAPLKRGTICTVVMQGDYGKPRPAVVVQSDIYAAHHSITICPFSSDVTNEVSYVRLLVLPDEENGLLKPSHIMVDKITTVPLRRIGKVVGRLQYNALQELDGIIAAFLGVE